MPLSVVFEMLASVIGQAVADAAGQAAVDGVSESVRKRREDARAGALATVDILVLAACHDRVVTDAERAHLAEQLPELLARAGVETTVEELIDRWKASRTAFESERELRRRLLRLTVGLSAAQQRRIFDAVVQLASADADGDRPSEGPYRTGIRPAAADTIRLFGEVLCIDAEVIEQAAAGPR